MKLSAYASLVCCAEAETHVAVAAEVLEQLDLAQGALGQNLLAKNIGDLLDGYALVGLVVDGGTGRRGYRQQLRRGRRRRGKRVSSRSTEKVFWATRCANSPDDTVSSLAELLGDSVALINNKVLVKDLEDLPSL
ncbi:unnamed protein product [Fusarium graminearum]|nr:unnamed protein product [Fusarium graminearum]